MASGESALPEWLPQARSSTVILMTLNLGLFAATVLFNGEADAFMSLDPQTLYLFGGMTPGPIAVWGQWWRFLTAGFLHGGIVHIALNSLGLFQLGNEVEEFFGTHRFFAIYLFSTMAGFWTSYFMGNPLSVGASAGVFGLLGGLIAYGVVARTRLGSTLKEYYTRVAIESFVMGLFMTMSGFMPIDNSAHFGGLAGGFVMGYVVGTPYLVENWKEKLGRAAGWIMIAVAVVAYASWAVWFFRV